MVLNFFRMQDGSCETHTTELFAALVVASTKSEARLSSSHSLIISMAAFITFPGNSDLVALFRISVTPS